jgi:hypothetical protein
VERYCRSGKATEDNITRRMHIACWIPKDANTDAEYVKQIVLPMRQWCHERSSVLRYTYIAPLAYFDFSFTLLLLLLLLLSLLTFLFQRTPYSEQ